MIEETKAAIPAKQVDKKAPAKKPAVKAEPKPKKVPTHYTAKELTSYHAIAADLNLAINGYELGALNGVTNSRYEVEKGQKIELPTLTPPSA